MSGPRRFAEGTSVPVDRSRSEIERLVRVHGATTFLSAWQKDRFVVIFEMRGKRVRLDVPAPDHKRFNTQDKWDREERRRWRVLLLLLKSKLEMVASGDADFDAEFLAYLTLPNGTTVGARVLQDLEATLSGKPMPPLLGA